MDGRTDGWTDQRTDGPTDRRTDQRINKPTYRDAIAASKNCTQGLERFHLGVPLKPLPKYAQKKGDSY